MLKTLEHAKDDPNAHPNHFWRGFSLSCVSLRVYPRCLNAGYGAYGSSNSSSIPSRDRIHVSPTKMTGQGLPFNGSVCSLGLSDIVSGSTTPVSVLVPTHLLNPTDQTPQITTRRNSYDANRRLTQQEAGRSRETLTLCYLV